MRLPREVCMREVGPILFYSNFKIFFCNAAFGREREGKARMGITANSPSIRLLTTKAAAKGLVVPLSKPGWSYEVHDTLCSLAKLSNTCVQPSPTQLISSLFL